MLLKLSHLVPELNQSESLPEEEQSQQEGGAGMCQELEERGGRCPNSF